MAPQSQACQQLVCQAESGRPILECQGVRCPVIANPDPRSLYVLPKDLYQAVERVENWACLNEAWFRHAIHKKQRSSILDQTPLISSPGSDCCSYSNGLP